MSIFIGNKEVGIGVYAFAPRYGATVGCFLGSIDSNGTLQAPNATFTFTSMEMVGIAENALNSRFKNNSGLTSVSLPNLTTVGTDGLKDAFKGCSNLTTVDFAKLSYGGLDGTFNGCSALELVNFTSATAIPTCAEGTFANTNATFKVMVPDALYEDWVAASGWASIAEHITKESDYAVVMTGYGGQDNMD